MVAAGLETLVHHGRAVLADGLQRKRLASLSGQSRQTFYTHFENHDQYLDELIHTVLDPRHPFWPVNDIGDYVDEVTDEALADTVGVITELARRDHLSLLTNDHWRLAVALWALVGEEPEVQAGLGRSWGFYHDRTTLAFEHLLARWQVELVPPWTMDKAAHVFAALSEGLALRADALDGTGTELLALTTATVAHAIVTPLGDPPDPLAPLIPANWDEPAAPPDSAALERALAYAMSCYLAEERPGFEAMAQAAGCAPAALRLHFDTPAGVVEDLWGIVATDLSARQARLDPDLGVLSRLRHRVQSLVSAAGRSRLLTADLLVQRDTGGGGTSWEDLAEPFVGLLREAGRVGALAYVVPARMLADQLLRTCLALRMAAGPPGADGRTDTTTAAMVWNLVIDGCRVATTDGAGADGAPGGSATHQSG